MTDKGPPASTGRCYCGKTRFTASQPPRTVAYCHCADCKRSTGAPVAAFAAFHETSVCFSPDEGQPVSPVEGVRRTFCPHCGSPLSGRYDYLPDTVYVPVGVLDNADDFPPDMHAHADNCLSWLHVADDLPRESGSARTRLNDAE